MKKIMSLALFALLVLGLSTARAENCVTLSMSCSRGLLLTAEDRADAGDTGERGWTGIVCGDARGQEDQIRIMNEIHCS